MPSPPSDLSPDARLRHELAALLRGRNAHVDLAAALAGIPADRVNERVEGLPHSLWDLVEHLRRTQADILEFCRPGYTVKTWPKDYWPDADARPREWEVSRAGVFDDLDALLDLAATGDLYDEFAWAPGYTLLREILLAADHNAHHLGQVVALRRQLGLWPPEGE